MRFPFKDRYRPNWALQKVLKCNILNFDNIYKNQINSIKSWNPKQILPLFYTNKILLFRSKIYLLK